jgi:hypothetical protein
MTGGCRVKVIDNAVGKACNRALCLLNEVTITSRATGKISVCICAMSVQHIDAQGALLLPLLTASFLRNRGTPQTGGALGVSVY